MIRRVAVALLIASLVTLGLLTMVAAARVSAGDEVVTIRIRDNTFNPAVLDIAEGTTVRWINDGRNTHNVRPVRGHDYGSPDLKPGRSYVHTFPNAGTFAYYCTLHGTPTSGQRGQLGVGDATTATPVEPVGASDAPPPTFRRSGRTIRV